MSAGAGVLDALEYSYPDPNLFRRWMQAFATSPVGSAVFAVILNPLDRMVGQLSRRRITVTGLFAGLPVVFLTTTGAKSGEKRTVPLLGIPFGADVALIGSNWGGQQTPGWAYNLGSEPRATLAYGNTTVRVTTRQATSDESNTVFDRAAGFYDGYAQYRRRAGHRTIKVFIVELETKHGT